MITDHVACEIEISRLRGRIARLTSTLETFAICNLHEGNCASLEIASKRIRHLAKMALSYDNTEAK
jgi:hypothetical protein